MRKITDSKEFNVGSISLILSIFGVMFSFVSWDGKYLGEHILSGINISFPYGLLSLIILFISYFIGYKYNNYFARTGRRIAIVFGLLIIVLSLIKQLS